MGYLLPVRVALWTLARTDVLLARCAVAAAVAAVGVILKMDLWHSGQGSLIAGIPR